MLNEQQQSAVRSIDGPLLVLAGAGSGKTRVITEKIGYLIKTCGIKASHILAVTFTNKAAKEMKERVLSTLDKDEKRGLHISTFHTLGLTIIKKHFQLLGYKQNFTLFDEQDSVTLIHEIAYEAFQSTKQIAYDIKQQISLWKNSLQHPHEIHLEEADSSKRQAYEVYVQYQKYLKAYNALDFDDLIFIPVSLLKQNAEVREYWQNRFHYILIDEYQDTNESQYQLLQLLTGKRQKFTVVGDDDQSIYAWRGARPENLSILHQDYPNLRIIKLEQNYRSSGRILHTANTLIEKNPHLFTKKLWSSHHYGKEIRVIQAKSEDDEAQRIASDIITHRIHHKTSYKDYAILVRGNHQSFLLERYLQLYKIPYEISGGSSFFAKTEIKDALAYFKLIINPEDDRAFLRIINTPRREIGAATLEKLGGYANMRDIPLFEAINDIALASHVSPQAYQKLQQFSAFISRYRQKIEQKNNLQENLTALFEDINYETWLIDNTSSLAQAQRRYENICELIGWICNRETETEFDFAQSINRMLLLDVIDREEEKEKNDKVQILTIHASKGLEYPYVYLIGCEEGILPHQQSIEDGTIEEERRLVYVAITRAKIELTLSLTSTRKKFNEKTNTTPSRFLAELPEDDLIWQGKAESSQEQRKSLAKSNIALLKSRFNS